jgi:hypothetical protein
MIADPETFKERDVQIEPLSDVVLEQYVNLPIYKCSCSAAICSDRDCEEF